MVVPPVRQHALVLAGVVPVGLLDARHGATGFGIAILHVIGGGGAEAIGLRFPAEIVPEGVVAVGPEVVDYDTTVVAFVVAAAVGAAVVARVIVVDGLRPDVVVFAVVRAAEIFG